RDRPRLFSATDRNTAPGPSISSSGNARCRRALAGQTDFSNKSAAEHCCAGLSSVITSITRSTRQECCHEKKEEPMKKGCSLFGIALVTIGCGFLLPGTSGAQTTETFPDVLGAYRGFSQSVGIHKYAGRSS